MRKGVLQKVFPTRLFTIGVSDSAFVCRPVGAATPTSVKTRFFWNRVLTASPSREKPFGKKRTCFNRTNCVRFRTRLLPSGRHPRVASLAPSGQFTFSCQPPALRNRGLTDVGHRRRRQRYPIPYCIDLRRNGYILNIFVRIASNFETYTIEYSNRSHFDPSRRDTSIFHSLRWPDFLIPFWVWFYSQSVL